MVDRLNSFQRSVSFLGALVFTAALIAASSPVVPVA